MHVTESYLSVATTHYFTEIHFNIILQCPRLLRAFVHHSLKTDCRSAVNRQTALYDTLVNSKAVHQAVSGNYPEPEHSNLNTLGAGDADLRF